MIAEAILENARRGNLEFFLKELPQSDLNLAKLAKQHDEDCRTLLHNACTSGNLERVKLISDAGSDVNHQVRD